MHPRSIFITSPNAELLCRGLIDNTVKRTLSWELHACPIHGIDLHLKAADQALLAQQLQDLHHLDLVIFISPNAVHASAQYLRQDIKQWPQNVAIACSGLATYQAWLAHFGTPPDTAIVAPPAGSAEDLFAMIQSAAQNKPSLLRRIAILRAQSGRDFLPAALSRAGAGVTLCTAYYRHLNPAVLTQATAVFAKINDVLPATSAPYFTADLDSTSPVYYYFSSSETLRVWHNYLTTLSIDLPACQTRACLLVSHPRIAKTAHALLWHDIVLVNDLSQWLQAKSMPALQTSPATQTDHSF